VQMRRLKNAQRSVGAVRPEKYPEGNHFPTGKSPQHECKTL
jgi:hypothetical protein